MRGLGPPGGGAGAAWFWGPCRFFFFLRLASGASGSRSGAFQSEMTAVAMMQAKMMAAIALAIVVEVVMSLSA